MSFFPELERLHLQKVNLVNEMQLLREDEKALRETVKILEEKLEVQESARPSFKIKALDWSASPEKVSSLYLG